MAHFGVQKAKALVLAGAIVATGVSLASAGNASAISDLNENDFGCSGAEVHEVYLKTANALKWAFKDQSKFYEANGTASCYVDWGSATPAAHTVKFFIESGEYNIDELITRDADTPRLHIYVDAGKDVTIKGASNSVGLYDDASTMSRGAIEVKEGGSLSFAGGKYRTYIINYGDVTYNGGVYENSYLMNYGGTVTVNDGDFSTEDAAHSGALFVNSSNGNITIKGGKFTGEHHDYNININSELIGNGGGTLTIEGGDFDYDFTNTNGIGTDDVPYTGAPGAMIRNNGTLKISGGNFGGENKGKGSLINQFPDSASTEITGGNFEVESIFTSLKLNGEESNSTLNVTGGKFNTRRTFYLVDDKDNIPVGQSPDGGGNPWGLWIDEDGEVRAGMATGDTGNNPYTLGSVAQNGLKGGDYSDSENVTPAPGYHLVELDTDFDGDGKKDVRIVKDMDNDQIEMAVGETKKPENLPEGAEHGSWSSDDESVCTVAEDGTITAIKAGTCHVTLKLWDGTSYMWTVKVTENPDTFDTSRAGLFTAAGAAIGGMTAIFATVRRFFGRK